MPLAGVRYRVKQTSKGPVRLAFRGGQVVEAKNLKTGAVHTPAEFSKERSSRGKKKMKRIINSMMRRRS